MATSIQSEKLRLTAELAALRYAVSTDVQTLTAKTAAVAGLFGSGSWLRRALIVGLGTWLGVRTARTLGAKGIIGVLTTTLLRRTARAWIRKTFAQVFG